MSGLLDYLQTPMPLSSLIIVTVAITIIVMKPWVGWQAATQDIAAEHIVTARQAPHLSHAHDAVDHEDHKVDGGQWTSTVRTRL